MIINFSVGGVIINGPAGEIEGAQHLFLHLMGRVCRERGVDL